MRLTREQNRAVNAALWASVEPDTMYPMPDSIKAELDDLRAAVKILSDGKWEKRDVSAVITILGSLAGLASAAFLLAQQMGLL